MTTTDTPVPEKPFKTGLRPFDPEKHARFNGVEHYGITLTEPTYPIDKRAGITDLGMGGNGPDSTFTINGGNPVGDCGPNVVPKNVNQTTAVLAGVAYTRLTSDQIGTLYFIYEAESAGVVWRPPWIGVAWSQADIDTASQLDQGVDLGDWLLWLFTHDLNGNKVEGGSGLIPGFVKIELPQLDAALATFDAIIVGVNLNPQAQNQFPTGWDVGPGDEPDPNDGHAITYGYAESASGPFDWGSWAQWARSTKAWKDACVQQAFAVLTDEETQASWYPALVADLKALGGTVAPGGATPPVTPPPVPPVTPPAPPAPVPPAPAPPAPIPPTVPPEHHGWWQELVALLKSWGFKIVGATDEESETQP